MEKHQLLKQIDAERKRFLETIKDLDEETLLTPGVTGEWSIKDILGHISVWEEECTAFLKARSQGLPWDKEYDIDAWNKEKYEEKKDQSVDGIREEFESSHQRLVEDITALPDSLLSDAQVVEWVEESTYVHYLEHLYAVQIWLDKRRPERGKRWKQGLMKRPLPRS